MAKKFLTAIDLNKNELQNVRLHALGAAPSNPVDGQMYWNTTDDKAYIYDLDSAIWIDMTATGGAGATNLSFSRNATTVTVESDTGSDAVLPAATSGLAGVLTAADKTKLDGVETNSDVTDAENVGGAINGVSAKSTPADSDKFPLLDSAAANALKTWTWANMKAAVKAYYDPVTSTFTNKTFDANGTGNSLSNVEVADFAGSAVVTAAEGIGNNNNDTTLPTSAAVKAYADSLLGAADAMTYKGGIDASTNPNYPAANAGDTYKITVAGKIGGASGIDVTAGDTLIATADGLSSGTHAAVGTSWTILQANVDRATTTTLGLAEYATATEAEARTDNTVALTPLSAANFALKKPFTIGDGTATQIDVIHNLGSKEVITQVRQASDDAVVECDITNLSTSVVRLNFSVAPAANALKVVVMG